MVKNFLITSRMKSIFLQFCFLSQFTANLTIELLKPENLMTNWRKVQLKSFISICVQTQLVRNVIYILCSEFYTTTWWQPHYKHCKLKLFIADIKLYNLYDFFNYSLNKQINLRPKLTIINQILGTL